MGLVQEGGGRLVGGGLLGAAIAEIGQGGEIVGAVEQAACCFRRSGGGGQNAQAHGQQIGGQGRLAAYVARHVAAGDVAGFVGDDPDQLVGVLGLLDQAGIDIDGQAAGGEGVDVLVADQHHVDVLGVQPRGFPDGQAVLVHDLLDLRVADDRDVLGVGEAGRQAGRQGANGGCRQQAEPRPLFLGGLGCDEGSHLVHSWLGAQTRPYPHRNLSPLLASAPPAALRLLGRC